MVGVQQEDDDGSDEANLKIPGLADPKDRRSDQQIANRAAAYARQYGEEGAGDDVLSALGANQRTSDREHADPRVVQPREYACKMWHDLVQSLRQAVQRRGSRHIRLSPAGRCGGTYGQSDADPPGAATMSRSRELCRKILMATSLLFRMFPRPDPAVQAEKDRSVVERSRSTGLLSSEVDALALLG